MKKALFIGSLIGNFLMKNACAQDALQVSQAGQQAAEARAKADETVGYYNLRWGDLLFRAESGLTIEGNDNVNLVNSDPTADVIFQPSINTQLTYPISQKNSLNLNVNFGYSAYVKEQNLDQFFVTPGTALSFDIYVKDFVINVHNFFSLTEQSYNNASAANIANYSYLQNTSGLRLLWDLDKLHVTMSYDYLILYSLNSINQQQNSSQHLFSLEAGADVNNFSQLGFQATAAIVDYQQAILNGGVQYSAGLYYRMRLSQNFSLRADAGYVIYNLNNIATASTNFQQQVNSFYGSLNLEHRVNQYLSYNLQIGRGLNAGLFSDTVNQYYARLETDLNVLRRCQIKLGFTYENGTETGGLGENFERYGISARISRPITQKLSASLNYYFWDRFSNLPDRSYTQNQVLLNLTYNF
jgi:hypothetical protein